MSKQIDEDVASSRQKYICHVNCTRSYTNLLLAALRPALNRQVKTGCRCCPPPAAPPGTWYTTGPHSGSPPNWNTYRGSGSARTTMWICARAETAAAADEEPDDAGFPTSTQPSRATTGRQRFDGVDAAT